MVFLVNRKDRHVVSFTDAELAKIVVQEASKEGHSLGVFSAKNKQLFLIIYPEFKGFTFVTT